MNKNYNSIGFLGFTVEHQKGSWRYIESRDIRTAILNRLASMTDSELDSEIEWGETVDNE